MDKINYLVQKFQNSGVMPEDLTKQDSIILEKFRKDFTNGSGDFIKRWNFQKDTSDVDEYFKDYLSSDGFKRIINNQNNWWESRHPYRKIYSNPDQGTLEWFETAKKIHPYSYTADMLAASSFSEPLLDEPNRVMIVGRINTDEHKFIETLGHEYAHAVSPLWWGQVRPFDPKSAQAEALKQNTNTKPGHDSQSVEKHADIWGLKYLFYKEGIYDSRGDKDITLDQVKQLRAKYPYLRPFKQMSDEQVMFMMNHVAQVNINSDSNLKTDVLKKKWYDYNFA